MRSFSSDLAQHIQPEICRGEPQSLEADTSIAKVYHSRSHQFETLTRETQNPFLAGAQITIADCVSKATLQYAEHLYIMPVSGGRPALAE